MNRLLICVVTLLCISSNTVANNQTNPIALYLTFDDGPNTAYNDATQGPTAELLAILDRHGVKATFFFPGESINAWEAEMVARIIESGHRIGIHSYHHSLSINPAMSNQDLADEFLLAYRKVISYLEEYPEALSLFLEQPPLYRRPGGSAHLMGFLNPRLNQSLNLTNSERALINRTFDYSGWSLSSGDSVQMVLRQINLGDPLTGTTETDQELVTEALWNFLNSGVLPSGTQTSYPGLSKLSENSDDLVILAHDNFMSAVQAWDVLLPRLIEEGYSFEVLPRPGDSPGSFIMGMG
jgi:peptidoglycan/xylan/chitin deacetylase (PgdA/CDA1 family)